MAKLNQKKSLKKQGIYTPNQAVISNATTKMVSQYGISGSATISNKITSQPLPHKAQVYNSIPFSPNKTMQNNNMPLSGVNKPLTQMRSSRHGVNTFLKNSQSMTNQFPSLNSSCTPKN